MIKCWNCSFENPANAKFCNNCGKPLERACPNCGTVNPANARFCNNCGFNLSAPVPAAAPVPSAAAATAVGGTSTVIAPATPPAVQALPSERELMDRIKQFVPKEFAERLLASRGTRPQAERRVVTILFCDVKGSTALGETMDPEEVLEIMNGAFDVLIEPVYRYEGTLARLMGDAILAFFGAPIAHEDDPVRAVLAALAIHEKMKDYAAQIERTHGIKGFAVRVGINTGLVVVGEVGSDLRVEYTAMGDAINLASRLETSAEPGTIVISENTARLVKYAFELESLGKLQVKGRAEPVAAFRVLGRKSVPEPARGIEGLHSPLVGRDREYQLLQSRVQELLHGRGQIVSVMGEAGLGKSRLVAELRDELMERGVQSSGDDPNAESGSLMWLEGRSLSYETMTPYAPFVHLFTNVFGLRPEQPNDEKLERLRSRLDELTSELKDELLPFLASLLGIPLTGADLERVRYLEPPALRGRIFAAVVTLFQTLAQKQPVVLVFEDLHWVDSTSLDLIQQLMPLAESAMLMLVAIFRPQRQEPSWRFHEIAEREYGDRYTAIRLEPLDEKSSRTLVANLLEIEDLPEKVRALILKKAEGNPFFVEEVIRSLLDAKLVVRVDSHWRATRDIENIAVPDTLAGVITARLDRLDEDTKRVAQTAAVIGREFQFDILQNVFEAPPVLNQALGNLQRRELVREKARMPLVVYLFKHALTQETAYASVLLSKRRELHRRVAEYLEKNEPERVNDIARNFLDAQDPKRALPYLIAAGESAAHAYSTPEAMQYLTRALEILKTVDDLALARRAYEGLGGVQTFANDAPGAVKTYEEMLALGKARGDIPMQVSALNKLSYVTALHMGQFPEAEAKLADAERLAREYQDKQGLAELFMMRCIMCTAVGDFDGVIHHMGEMVELGREQNVERQMVMGLEHIAQSQIFMTQFDEAAKTTQQGLALADKIGDTEHKSAFLAWELPLIHLRNGELDQARQSAEEGLRLALHIGSMMNVVLGSLVPADIARLRGEYEQAIHYFQQSVQFAFPAEQFMPFLLVPGLGALGSTLIEISPQLAPRANQSIGHALELFKNPASVMSGAMVWNGIGFADLELGNLDRATQMFQQAIDSPGMFRNLEMPRAVVGSALVWLERGDVQTAQNLVAQARDYVQERKMKNLYPLVALAAGKVALARGDAAGALEQFARAEADAIEMGMRPMIWQARAGAAQALDALGRAEEAGDKHREALAVVDEIANLFEDQKLRELFVESARNKI